MKTIQVNLTRAGGLADDILHKFAECWREDHFQSFLEASKDYIRTMCDTEYGTDFDEVVRKEGSIFTLHECDSKVNSMTPMRNGNYMESLVGIGGYVPISSGVIALRWMAVLPKHRNKGYGKELIRQAIIHYISANIDALRQVDPTVASITVVESYVRPETGVWYRQLGFVDAKQEVVDSVVEVMGFLEDATTVCKTYWYGIDSGRPDFYKELGITTVETERLRSDFPSFLVRLARKHHVTLERCSDCSDNQAAMAGNSIMMGKFDDEDIEETAFFHELGHIVNNRNSIAGRCLSKLSDEGAAWETAMNLAASYGRTWPADYYSKQQMYARECLASYMKDEYL